MRSILIIVLVGFVVGLIPTGCRIAKDAHPNLLMIMVDDMGYSDLGCYGGEIRTPNLDKLANKGIRFSNFSNCARCWPSRAAFLTGFYPQQIGRDNAPGISGGGAGKRPDWARLLPIYLKEQGYRSYHSGKWHIDGMPVENGFNRSYFLADQGRFFNPQKHFFDDDTLPPVEKGKGYYATVEIADRAIDQLKEHKEKYSEQPFFSFVAFTAPHFPLHALPEDIEAIGNRYEAGWDLLRRNRWEQIQKMGIVQGKLSEVEPDLGPPYHFPDAIEILGEGEVNRPVIWENLTDKQKEFQKNKMIIHAAMVERVDKEIGRIISQIEKMRVLNNTLILFLSDNGASAEIMVRDDGHLPFAEPGSAETYLCIGPGWSTMSNTPFRKHKTWVHQGGVSTPLIIFWPDGIKAQGELRHTHGHITDIVPTILDLVGFSKDHMKEIQFPGQSLKPIFERDTVWNHPVWYYHEGNRAIRNGEWKLVAAKNSPWELYNLGDDPTESTNIVDSFPAKFQELEKLWYQMLLEMREVTPYKSAEDNNVSITTKNIH
jgi:arylsulfatase A-like enzyme